MGLSFAKKLQEIVREEGVANAVAPPEKLETLQINTSFGAVWLNVVGLYLDVPVIYCEVTPIGYW